MFPTESLLFALIFVAIATISLWMWWNAPHRVVKRRLRTTRTAPIAEAQELLQRHGQETTTMRYFSCGTNEHQVGRQESAATRMRRPRAYEPSPSTIRTGCPSASRIVTSNGLCPTA